MHLKGRLLRRPSIDERKSSDLQALPRFSFESSSHSVLSTERLFRQWNLHDVETQYGTGDFNMEETNIESKEIIVGRESSG